MTKVEKVHRKINISIIIFLLFIIALVSFILFVLVLYKYDSSLEKTEILYEDNREIDSNLKIYEVVIDKIKQDCGSIHITTNQKGKYSVFKEICNEDGYCKYDYIPLENCLK